MSTTIGKVILESEEDYWKAIEGLGGMIFSLNHDLADGRIDDPDGEVSRSIDKQREIQQTIGEGLSRDFGIILTNDPLYPKDVKRDELPPPPEGKRWYWTWYEEMKAKIFGWEYDHLICSACPYTEGRETYISFRNGQYPCEIICGWRKVHWPSQCGKTGWPDDKFTREVLLAKIQTEHGEDAVNTFLDKETELKQQEANGILKPNFGF